MASQKWYNNIAVSEFGVGGYNEFYKRACKQSNMSCSWLMNGLRLGPVPSNDAIDNGDVSEDGESDDEAENSMHVKDAEAAFQPGKPVDFSNYKKFPPHLIARIVMYVLLMNTRVHAVTRFDKYTEIPWQGPVGCGTRLPHRLALESKRNRQIDTLPKPNDILAFLGVSKFFCEIGTECFYMLNTFVFSSLGEMGYFLTGIGRARRQRIQFIDLMWIGSRMEKSDGTSDRMRILPLIGECINLKELNVWRDETIGRRKKLKAPNKRRPNPKNMRTILEFRTKDYDDRFQDYNWWTMQGFDELRTHVKGARVNFYDCSTGEFKRPIRCRSFVRELRRYTSQPKSEAEIYAAERSNLDPLFPGSALSAELFSATQRVINHFPADIFVQAPNARFRARAIRMLVGGADRPFCSKYTDPHSGDSSFYSRDCPSSSKLSSVGNAVTINDSYLEHSSSR